MSRSHIRFSLALLFIVLPSSALAEPLLTYCLQHIKNVGQPAEQAIERHRQFAQLILLQDQLKMLAQQGNSESLGRCTLALNSAMLPYQQRQALPDALMTLQIQLRQLEHKVDQQVSLQRAECQLSDSHSIGAHIDLAAKSVWRYLYQAKNDHCKQQVWRAYQNRGGDKANILLSQYKAEIINYIAPLGFASVSEFQTQHTPLRTAVEIRAFLESLPNTEPKLPWQPSINYQSISTAPQTVAHNVLFEIAKMFDLTLKPIDEQQWQVWEQHRFLGYIHLQGSSKHQVQQLQSHWLGISPAVMQLSYRDKPWKSHHWTRWVALVAESLVNMAGAPLPYAHAPISGFGTGFGRALARNASFQQKLLGKTIDTRPLFSSQALYDAQMALIISEQTIYNEAQLRQHSEQLFSRYFQHDAPTDLKPWRSRSDWAISGARAYLPLWQAEQGRIQLEQLMQGRLTSKQLWQTLVQEQNQHLG